MHLAFLTVGNIIIWSALLACFLGRLSRPQCSGIIALGCIPFAVGFALDGATSVASVFAALGAVNAWGWWHGGGGDGTRRRLKNWARRFQGVRRTAPQGA